MANFGKGLMAPFRGFFFLWGTPGLRAYLFVPGMIQLGVFIGLCVAAVFAFTPLLQWLLPESMENSTTAQIVGGILLGVLLLAAIVLFTSLIAGILAAPILDVMSEKVLRAKLGDKFRPASTGIVKTLRNQLGHAVVFVFAQALLFALWIAGLFVPVVGSVLVTIVSIALTGYLLCVNHIDYPMGIAGGRWRDRYSYFLRRFAAGVGFGTHLFFLQFVPFSISASVAGACLLYAEEV
jgi:CysZ protein